jgi:iron complex outermembrane receptor protein
MAMASLSLLAPMALASPSNPAPTEMTTASEAIVIFASRFEGVLENADPQTRIITDQEIQQSGLVTVSDVLQKIGGLHIKQNLDGSSNGAVDIRGFGDASDNNVLILLDGIRLSENEQAAARTSQIPLEAIDHIEITRGGNSVLYGDGATGGTINIVTKSNLKDLTVATAGLGSYSALQSGIFHARKQDDVSLTFFGRQSKNAGYRSSAGTDERSAGFSGIKHISANDKLGIRIVVGNERNKLPGALPIAYLNSNPRTAQVPDYQSNTRVNTSSITLFGSTYLRSDIQLKVDFNHTKKSNNWDYNYNASTIYDGYDPANYLVPGQSPYAWGHTNSNSHTNSFNPRLKFDDFVMQGGNLIVGYDWREFKKSANAYKTDSDSRYYSWPFGNSTNITDGSFGDQSFKTQGAYLKSQLPINTRDTVTLGMRSQTYRQSSAANYYNGGNTASCDPGSCDPFSTQFSNKGKATAYEMQYTRVIQQNLKAYLRAGQNFRFANLDDNAQTSMAANNNLKPQTSHDSEIGVTYKNDPHSASLVVYASQLTNEIGFDGANNVNFDPTKRHGMELRDRFALTPQVTLLGSVNLGESKFTSGSHAGRVVPGTSDVTGAMGAQYQLDAKQRVGWQTRFASSAYASNDLSNTQRQRPGFGVSDLNYAYAEKNWQWIGSINNVFNKNYADSAIYKSAYKPLYQFTVYPNPGRNVGITGRYSF